MSECKHCAMESHDCDYCCDGAHIDLLEKENSALRSIKDSYDKLAEIEAETEKENAELRELSQRAISFLSVNGIYSDDLQEDLDKLTGESK